MDKSFSLEFKPLSNVKTVKDYEDEIQKLRSENFQLKTQLTHSSAVNSPENLPEILYKHNQQVSQLQKENNNLSKRIDEMNYTIEQLSQEKRLLENNHSQEALMANERLCLLEDENKRLILRMEKMNKDSADSMKFKAQLGEAENVIKNLKMMVQNLEKHNEQLKYEFNKQISEIKSQADAISYENENAVKNKDFEIMRLKNELESEINKNNNNMLIINDLKNTLSYEIKEKNRLNGLESSLKTEYESKLREFEEYKARLQRESKVYMNGMERFKNIFSSKLSIFIQELNKIKERTAGLNKAFEISPENLRFLAKLKIKANSINGIISAFKELFIDAHKKIEFLKKEAADSTFFAGNERKALQDKHAKMYEGFKIQLNEAKNELLLCRQYLEKKAKENKELKNENARLMSEMNRKIKQIDNAKVIYNGMMNKMGYASEGLKM